MIKRAACILPGDKTAISIAIKCKIHLRRGRDLGYEVCDTLHTVGAGLGTTRSDPPLSEHFSIPAKCF